MKSHYFWAKAVFLAAALLSGCATEQPPAVDRSPPIDVSLAKLIQPAFFNQYGGHNVRFTAAYNGPYATSADLPDYSNYFRFMVCTPGPACTGLYPYVYAPTDMADRLAEMKVGRVLHLTAFAQPVMLYGRQPQLLLIVSAMDAVETKKKHK